MKIFNSVKTKIFRSISRTGNIVAGNKHGNSKLMYIKRTKVYKDFEIQDVKERFNPVRNYSNFERVILGKMEIFIESSTLANKTRTPIVREKNRLFNQSSRITLVEEETYHH